MLPSRRQSLIMLVAIAAGAAALISAAEAVMPADGQPGLVLADAGPGPWLAAGLMAIALVPAVAAGVVAASTGRRLAGPFCVGVAMAMLAWSSGPIDGWLRRSGHDSSYATLAAETLFWLLPILAVVILPRWRDQLPGWWPMAAPRPAAPDVSIRPTIIGIGLVALIGGLAAWPLAATTAMPQATLGVFLAFLLAGAVVGHWVPQADGPWLTIGPAGAAVVAYLGLAFTAGDQAQLLTDWYADNLRGLGLTLPTTVIGAGAAGVATGIAWWRPAPLTDDPAADTPADPAS
ncbi:MAG: hypothetical protein R3336_06070 [Phycisphaeraceae bacterium]|nr:hypothetical protein [Phycisphaeraceae bacterium]